MPTFLIVILWVLAVLLLLIVLILFLPAQALIEYKNEEFFVKARVLFATIKLYPRTQKPEKEQREKQQDEKSTEKQPEKPKKKRTVTLDKITRILNTANNAMKMIFKNMQITFSKVVWPVYGGDAAETAIAYGQMQAYIGGVLGVLQQFLKINFKSVNIFADYDNNHEKERYIYCKIGASPFIIISAALYVFNRLKHEKLI